MAQELWNAVHNHVALSVLITMHHCNMEGNMLDDAGQRRRFKMKNKPMLQNLSDLRTQMQLKKKRDWCIYCIY